MAKISYQELKTELDGVMLSLQREDLDIDEALELYKRGQALIKELENYLKNAENTIKKLKSQLDNKNS